MKRGASGLSLLVAIDKPKGLTSHDVVNRVRRVFGERRVGHTGTLDPLATGVLPICVGPATRLDQFMTGHDKSYRVDIAFGCETTTDDVEGQPTVVGQAPSELMDESFMSACLKGFVGTSMQVPPRYSAIKVGGRKAYEIARRGGELELEPRPIEVYRADPVACYVDGPTGLTCWRVDLSVSKGTYVRALARDIGRAVGCPAHVAALQRRIAGRIALEDCDSMESLEARGAEAALDPVAVLGFRFAFGDDVAAAVNAGASLRMGELSLYEPLPMDRDRMQCTCTSGVVASGEAPLPGEVVCVVVENRLKALYSASGDGTAWRPSCVFSVGLTRG